MKRLYEISVRLKHELLGGDTLHMFVQADSWDEFEQKTNLGMWLDDDDVIGVGAEMGFKKRETQFRRGQESLLKTAKTGDWFPIRGRAEACITVHEVDEQFLARITEMDLLMEQGSHGAGSSF